MRLKRHFRKTVEPEKVMKRRNFTAVFDVSLDYWNNLKNQSIHSSSSHAVWGQVPDWQLRMWLWKPLRAITYVFILLKMKLMCRSVLSSWQWELHNCPFSTRVTFCCLQPPRIRLICFLDLLIPKACCFLLFIYLNLISLCTLSVFCSPEAFFLFLSLPNHPIWRSCKFFLLLIPVQIKIQTECSIGMTWLCSVTQTAWQLEWVTNIYFLSFFFFWLVKKSVGIFIIIFDTIYNLVTLETVFQQPWKGLVKGIGRSQQPWVCCWPVWKAYCRENFHWIDIFYRRWVTCLCNLMSLQQLPYTDRTVHSSDVE